MRYFLTAVIGMSVVATTAVAQTASTTAPLMPIGPWNVEYAEQMCLISRPYRSGSDTVIFGIRTGLSEAWSTLFVAQPLVATDTKNRRGTMVISAGEPAGKEKQPFESRVAPAAKLRFLTTEIEQSTIDAIEQAKAVTLVFAGKETQGFSVTNLAKAREALRLCDRDLMKSWGFDLAAREKIATPAKFTGSPAQFFGPGSYPSSARAVGETGRVVTLFSVGTDGRAHDCKVVISAKSEALDKVTCQIISRNVRMTPAKDASGAAIGSQEWLAVRWSLEE